jgi:glycosyltransferase involved in cell wall biosynthesis
MKIVHLNTHPYGGAAVVARRLHLASQAEGITSAFITKVGGPASQTPGHIQLTSGRLAYALRQQSARPHVYRIGKYVQDRLQPRNLVGRPARFEVFSPANTGTRFADCLQAYQPDLVHLHWIAGFVDHAAFFRQNQHRKFVWTLHDMNPFTGGCHYSYGCQRFASCCTSCPQLRGTIDPDYAERVIEAKTQALAALRADQLVITAPSQWLLDLSAQSRITSRFRHVRIDNPTFAAQSRRPTAELRRELGLPLDDKIVVFIADNLRNPRKGVELLFAAARTLQARGRVHFVGLGQRTDAPADVPITFAGNVSDEARLARYLQCADVLVSPSAAENAPLVVIEALTCGTPVVGFRVGGIPELVSEQSGLLVEERSAPALAAGLEAALFHRTFDRRSIVAGAARHAPATVMRRYRELYDELLTA